MGYYMNQTDSKFSIKKKNLNKVVKAIQELRGKESIIDSSGRNFSWVDHDFYEKTNISDILNCWRWEVAFDKGGNVNDITFQGEKFGDDKVLFNSIASYVQDGSYIEIVGEDNQMWRWVFQDGKCFEKYPEIKWD
jgi:hypothetical protein